MSQKVEIFTKHSGYLSNIFTSTGELDKTVNFTIKNIREYIQRKKISFEFVAVTGVSGLVVGSIVAHKLKKRLIVVRKKNDSSNATCEVEGIPSGHNQTKKRYIIIDDLISSGGTIRRIISQIKNHNKDCRCIGICTYNVPVYSWRTCKSHYTIGYKEFFSNM